MTTLTIYRDSDAKTPLAHHEDFVTIQRELAAIGIEFERWQANKVLSPLAEQAEVLEAYADSIERLNAKYGFKSMDVVSMHPDHPQAAGARGKFLAEHTHDDFEIRFFVDGEGMFYIRKNGKVYMTRCCRGDLINLPADTTHWFDMGPRPNFKAIRLFTAPDGWVGRFTGDRIAESFPAFQN
ncbi:MAG TPA: cupin [Nevskiaceae bacterium]|nr:cupin [Nevskiaceae bacterium]